MKKRGYSFGVFLSHDLLNSKLFPPMRLDKEKIRITCLSLESWWVFRENGMKINPITSYPFLKILSHKFGFIIVQFKLHKYLTTMWFSKQIYPHDAHNVLLIWFNVLLDKAKWLDLKKNRNPIREGAKHSFISVLLPSCWILSVLWLLCSPLFCLKALVYGWFFFLWNELAVTVSIPAQCLMIVF